MGGNKVMEMLKILSNFLEEIITVNNLPSDWMILKRRMPSQGVRKLDANVSS